MAHSRTFEATRGMFMVGVSRWDVGTFLNGSRSVYARAILTFAANTFHAAKAVRRFRLEGERQFACMAREAFGVKMKDLPGILLLPTYQSPGPIIPWRSPATRPFEVSTCFDRSSCA